MRLREEGGRGGGGVGKGITCLMITKNRDLWKFGPEGG